MAPYLASIAVLCVVGISCGQLLFKKAALSMPNIAEWHHWILNGWLIVALALYGLTTLLWVWLLRHAPLHMVYPFMGLAFVIVPCLEWIFLNEPIRLSTIAGGILILAGITISTQKF